MLAELSRVFASYCSPGDGENLTHLSSAKFARFTREAGIVGCERISPTDVDLIFVKAAQPATSKRAGGKAHQRGIH